MRHLRWGRSTILFTLKLQTLYFCSSGLERSPSQTRWRRTHKSWICLWSGLDSGHAPAPESLTLLWSRALNSNTQPSVFNTLEPWFLKAQSPISPVSDHQLHQMTIQHPMLIQDPCQWTKNPQSCQSLTLSLGTGPPNHLCSSQIAYAPKSLMPLNHLPPVLHTFGSLTLLILDSDSVLGEKSKSSPLLTEHQTSDWS